MLKHEIYCLFGIPFHISYEFRLAGKRYRVNPEGVETLKLFLGSIQTMSQRFQRRMGHSS